MIHSKTRLYTIVLEDGSLLERVWGGNCRSIRIALEDEGYRPMAIFQRVRPLWVRNSLKEAGL